MNNDGTTLKESIQEIAEKIHELRLQLIGLSWMLQDSEALSHQIMEMRNWQKRLLFIADNLPDEPPFQ